MKFEFNSNFSGQNSNLEKNEFNIPNVNNLPKVIFWQCSRLESIWGSFGHQSDPLLLDYQVWLKKNNYCT